MFRLKYILNIMAPIGQIRTHGMNCSQQLDFKHLRNVPKFAEEDTTNQNIINKVNKATSELENKLNRKIDNLRLDIQDVFGGTFPEIKERFNITDDNDEIPNKVLTTSRIQDIFGGSITEIKEVYGNLGNVHEKLDNINQLNRLTPQSNNNLQNQILTSRINNVEQLLLNLQK